MITGNKNTSPDFVLSMPHVRAAVARGIVLPKGDRAVYSLRESAEVDFTDPDEWNRTSTVAALIVTCGIEAERLSLGDPNDPEDSHMAVTVFDAPASNSIYQRVCTRLRG